MSSAARPSRAARMRWPVPCSVRTSTCRFTGLSSTTRIVAGGGGSADVGAAAGHRPDGLARRERGGQRAQTRRSRTTVTSRADPAAERRFGRARRTSSSCASASRSVTAPSRRRLARAARRCRARRGRSSTAGSAAARRPAAGDEPHAEVRLQRGEQRLGAHRLRQVVDAAGVDAPPSRVSPNALAVTAITGMSAVAGSAFSRRVASSPSRSPILRSMKIDVGRCLRASAIASRPPAAVITRTPALSSRRREDPAVHRAVVRDERRHVLAVGQPRVERRRGAARRPMRRSRADAGRHERQVEVEPAALARAGSRTRSSPPILRDEVLADGQAQARCRRPRRPTCVWVNASKICAESPRARCRRRCRSPRTAAGRRRPSRSSSCTSPCGVNLMALLEQVQQHLAQVPAVEHDAPRHVGRDASCRAAAPCAARPRPPGT